ncbi:hypothetical protein DM01DRAFT_1286999 [Hesseltinella vesiculosa]|uniref:Anp1-domain-containing protein n=1 Tax=Hesseltinella vesiculosa TaxID=101127 RepID=A0A1X2GIA7_9FUNG|nr:hypothetical protein DM01DRAFT_1286999 [Hesseltinella vesiculosa]
MTRLALLVLNPASPASVHAVRNAVKASQLPFSVQLYTKSFDDSIARWVQQDDHQQGKVYELEPFHKSAMARARNYLLQTALDPMDQYVIWLDPMLEDFPPTLIEDMQRIMDKGTTHDDKPATIDVLAPNTMIIKDGTEWGYERGNWQETELSKALHDTVAEDFVFMEGWWEFDTHRFLMLDMMTSGSNETLVALDGVGGSCLFVRADVHRGGINFPPYVYKNQLDTESFAKAALTDGYGVYGLPNYKLLHSQPLAHLNSNE